MAATVLVEHLKFRRGEPAECVQETVLAEAVQTVVQIVQAMERNERLMAEARAELIVSRWRKEPV